MYITIMVQCFENYRRKLILSRIKGRWYFIMYSFSTGFSISVKKCQTAESKGNTLNFQLNERKFHRVRLQTLWYKAIFAVYVVSTT